MKTLVAAPFLLLLWLCFPVAEAHAALAKPSGYARRIVGRWVDRKIIHYRADGTWGLQRTDDGPLETRGMRWRVEGDRLILTSPHGSFVGRIISVDRERLVTVTAAGERLVATRYRPVPRHGRKERRLR